MSKIKLIPKHKIGYVLDYDPKNPYHVHHNDEKIVITPEQYEKHKNEPYFANIRKQVEEHQAAYPGPEYTETPNPEYRKVYANVKARSNQHFKEHNFNGQTHREYSVVPEAYFRNSVDGVVTDEQGNLYRPMAQTDIGKGVTPMFTTTERDYRNGRNFDMSWVRVKTPSKTIKTLKQPLSVNRAYNVDEELDNAVDKYINDPNNIVNSVEHSNPFAIQSQAQTVNRTPNNDGITVNESEGWDPGTLKQSDWIKIFKPTMHPELFKLYSKDPDIWKFPTKQQALNNIQLNIHANGQPQLQTKKREVNSDEIMLTKTDAHKPDTLTKPDSTKQQTLNNTQLNTMIEDKRKLSPIEFLTDYVNSESFASKAPNQAYINAARNIVKKKVNIKTGKIASYDKSKHTIYMPNSSTISGKLPEDFLIPTPIPYDEVLAHEFGHTMDALKIKPNPTHTYAGKKTKFPIKAYVGVPKHYEKLYENTKDIKLNPHDMSNVEKYADLQQLRYTLYKEGIFDARQNIPFTKEHLKKAKEKGLHKRTRTMQVYDDDTIIKMLNTIAYNDNNTRNVNLAQNGGNLFYKEGLIPKHQSGQKITQKNPEYKFTIDFRKYVNNHNYPEYERSNEDKKKFNRFALKQYVSNQLKKYSDNIKNVDPNYYYSQYLPYLKSLKDSTVISEIPVWSLEANGYELSNLNELISYIENGYGTGGIELYDFNDYIKSVENTYNKYEKTPTNPQYRKYLINKNKDKNSLYEASQFVLDYYSSPGYKERATKYNIERTPLRKKSKIKVLNAEPGEGSNAHIYREYIRLDEDDKKLFTVPYIISHELGHFNPLYNTRSKVKTDDSPYSNNDYSDVPPKYKDILLGHDYENDHDAELSENYSDLMGLRESLFRLGIFDSKKSGSIFTQKMLDEYRKTNESEKNRFLKHHTDQQIIDAVNEIAYNGSKESHFII